MTSSEHQPADRSDTGDRTGWLRKRAESRTGLTVKQPAPLASPWRPSLLARMDPALVSRLTYVVLDEREPAAPLSVIGDDQGGQLLFLLTNWPRVDALGRVRHGTGRPVEIAVPVNRWQATMTERRLPEVLRERPPRIGDTFAMMLESRHPKYLLNPIGPVVDVTADARDAAKEAFYGAVAAPLDAEVAVGGTQVVTTASLPEPEQWRAYLERSR